AGLTTDKILSQCYDGASVMSGKRGGVQKILQEKVEREVPYVHCFNHQLHLVVIHAMSSENTLQVFFDVCDMLYRFLKKPTVSAVYTGQRLKRLLDQRWTGHLGTVSVIVNSYDAVEQFLAEIDSSGLPTQLRVEAAGLLKAVQEPHFKFTAVMVHKILALLDPPNKVLQDKKTDLYTGVKVVKSALDCVEHLRSDSEFQAIWAQCSTGSSADASEPAAHPPMKRVCQVPTHLKQYVVESNIGQQDIGSETECKRLFFSTLDSVIGEMNRRFLNETASWSRRFVPLTQKILTSWMCRRKACMIQLACEADLTKQFREKDWKERLFRKFNKQTRRLQLY
ncbi:hypothetical protein JOQ06_023673, partial [Pogonophryne albipinna]